MKKKTWNTKEKEETKEEQKGDDEEGGEDWAGGGWAGRDWVTPSECDTDRDGETSVVVERAAEADEWRDDDDAAGGDDDVDRYRHQRVAH